MLPALERRGLIRDQMPEIFMKRSKKHCPKTFDNLYIGLRIRGNYKQGKLWKNLRSRVAWMTGYIPLDVHGFENRNPP
jgi:hypothetical protein